MANQKTRLLIALVLSISIQLLLTAIVAAQSPTPRELILEQIRVDAGRHAKSGSPMQTQLVLDLYRSNNVGLTLTEIAHTYEEEYIKQKEALKPSPWEKLRPNIASIVALILALLFILYRVLEKWTTRLIESLGERLGNTIASSSLFKTFTLRRYQKGLSERYAELRIPFSNRPLKMREVYVPLKVAGSSGSEQFDAQQAIARHRRLMIVGPPGSGKSMLLKYLAFNYAEGRMKDLVDNPVPILLELHYLSEKPGLTLDQHLVEALARNRFPHGERFVSQSLPQGRLMLLLDGLDEVNSTERSQVINKIRDLLDQQRDSRVVITCRNAVYKGEFFNQVDETLEIIEFSDQQVRNFLSSWEPYMPAGRSVEQLMHTLRDRPRIMALARNPLLLTIISYLYTDTPYVLPHSRAEFYRQSTDVLLRQWHQERNNYESRDKQAVLQRLALHFMDSTAARQQDRLSLDFQTVLEQVKQLLPKLNLRQDEDVRPLLNEIVERSGLLLSIDGGQRYQFAHLTLQEYFAAEELMDDAHGLIARFLADHDPWRETIKIWCGLGPNSTSLVKTVYEADVITAFECLADAKLVDQQLSDKILDSFYRRLGTGGDDDDAISRAFGAVAADLRPRGAAVFNFLKATLSNTTDHVKRVAAANALSLTNLPEAAKTLAEHYADAPEIRAALVRMGDLAVPCLEALAKAGTPSALEDLNTVGTPQAAEVLVDLLWTGDEDLGFRSAWILASLLRHANVEDALRRYPLQEHQRRLPRLDWIWRPFGEPAESSLPIINGRIAFMLELAPVETAPSHPPKLDPRLVVPLCCISQYHKLADSLYRLQPAASTIEAIADTLGYPKDRVYLGHVYMLRKFFDVAERNSEAQAQQAREVVEAIINSPQMEAGPAYCLRSLPRDLQLKILRVVLARRMPVITDWINLFRPVRYDITNAWHYRVVTAFALSISLFALFEIGLLIYNSPSVLTWRNGLLVLAMVPMFVAPRTLLWAGSSSFEISGRRPVELLAFGLLGVVMAPVNLVARLFSDLTPPVYIDLDDIFEYFQILSCGFWLPLIWYFTTPRLLTVLPWQLLIVAWLILLAICALIALRGTRLDKEATNPLHGLLDTETIVEE